MRTVLSDIFRVNRRYSRSVSLDRDLGSHTNLDGYVLTPKNRDLAIRIIHAICEDDIPRAWTLTGLYGTGKSSFAQFLLGLCAPTVDPMNSAARRILRDELDSEKRAYASFRRKVGRRGLVRAATASRREPIANTVTRALSNGARQFWQRLPGSKPNVVSDLARLENKILKGAKIPNESALEMVQRVAEASKSGLFLIIDELGKSLEFTSINHETDDLYLLQQIAELPSSKHSPIICILGILHQAFADYGHNLATVQRNEWAKIQGRFEDVPFTEPVEQFIKIMGQVIEPVDAGNLPKSVFKAARNLVASISASLKFQHLSLESLTAVFPLHPISAAVLPVLCDRFGQNDRSVFSFLTSEEPCSFQRFLTTSYVDGRSVPTLKLDWIYDYFVESIGLGMARHRVFQRWSEIQSAVSDASNLGVDRQRLIKAIGVLNIASQSGTLRGHRELVVQAMCDDPSDSGAVRHWRECIEDLISRGRITYRRQVDELRIWEGSDFDAERALQELLPTIREPLSIMLSRSLPLRPLAVSRHSYLTGTLRFFERRFIDESVISDDSNAVLGDTKADGLLLYWVGSPDAHPSFPSQTHSKRPIVVIVASDLDQLRHASLEHTALGLLQSRTPELLTDGVARKELRQRLSISRRILEDAFRTAVDGVNDLRVIIQGKQQQLVQGLAELNSVLSRQCDISYAKGPRLWNELINRDSLTSQAAKARRELIEAMVLREGQPMLGLTGYGPERSMFESLLHVTGIYCQRRGKWQFGDPEADSGICDLWRAAESFCTSATDTPRCVSQLYEILKNPPYGAKTEIIPIFFAAILMKHADDMSLYQDGSFVPVLGSEHFELLVKRPERFSVKHFELRGVRTKLFRELESALRTPSVKRRPGLMNRTLLGIVRPLVRFIRGLPQYTLQTQNLDSVALTVRDALKVAKEPDRLLFEDLPKACGFPPISELPHVDEATIRSFKGQLINSLKNLNAAYEALLDRSREQMRQAFSVESQLPQLREHMRVRASYLMGICIEPRLRSFITASLEDSSDDKHWLETLLMIIADKPVGSWTDEDELMFEMNVHEMARKFQNMEALQKVFSGKPGKGFVARRIVLTRPNGEEASRIFWVERGSERKIGAIVSRILKEHRLDKDSYLFQGVLASLLDRSLFDEDDANCTADDEESSNEKTRRSDKAS